MGENKIFIELNDSENSVICMNDIVAFKKASYSIKILFRNTKDVSYFSFDYELNSTAIDKDLQRLKNLLSGTTILCSRYIAKENNLYTKGDYNYEHNN